MCYNNIKFISFKEKTLKKKKVFILMFEQNYLISILYSKSLTLCKLHLTTIAINNQGCHHRQQPTRVLFPER